MSSRAPDEETYTDNVPLAFTAKQVQQLTKVVDQTSNLHPFGLAVASDCLGSLKQMLNLRKLSLDIY
jgi:hypothetical protein